MTLEIANEEIDTFLKTYPLMSLRPTGEGVKYCFEGKFEFRAQRPGWDKIEESFKLKIEILNTFPKKSPRVFEIDHRIPLTREFHVNPDKSLCLGSPLRVLLSIKQDFPLRSFIDNCLVPYLYAVSVKLIKGGKFLMGELEHGESGVISDYMDLMGLNDEGVVKQALILVSMKKRTANKKHCPCCCGKRLGKCRTRIKINQLRSVVARSWFSRHAVNLNMII